MLPLIMLMADMSEERHQARVKGPEREPMSIDIAMAHATIAKIAVAKIGLAEPLSLKSSKTS